LYKSSGKFYILKIRKKYVWCELVPVLKRPGMLNPLMGMLLAGGKKEAILHRVRQGPPEAHSELPGSGLPTSRPHAYMRPTHRKPAIQLQE